MKPTTSHAVLAISSSALLLLTGCAGAQSVDYADAGTETPDAGPPDGGSGPAGKTVLVTYSGSSTPVDLSQPSPVIVNGAGYAKVSDVVLLAVTTKTIDQLKVTNVLGADGFSPLSKGNCAALFPIDGATLVKGYVDPSTRNLKWDDSLGYPGCLSVKDAAEFLVADK